MMIWIQRVVFIYIKGLFNILVKVNFKMKVYLYCFVFKVFVSIIKYTYNIVY